MKKLMMIIMLFTSLNVIAQNERHDKEFIKDLSAEEIATLKTKKLTLHLDLNESQQEKVKALMLAEAEHKEKQKAKFKKSKDEEKPTKEEKLALINERLDHQIEMKKQIKTILTEDQYDKWDKHFSRKGHKKRKNKHRQKPGR